MKDSFVILIFGPDPGPSVSIATLLEAPADASLKEMRDSLQEMAQANAQTLGWTPAEVREIRILGPMSRLAAQAVFDATPGQRFSHDEYKDLASRLGGNVTLGHSGPTPTMQPRSGIVS